MSEMESNESKASGYDKGDRAAIVSGRSGVGVRGSVFWIGENKYGPGMRYGLRGDDGATYWVDEADLGPEDQAPPAPEKAKEQGPTLDKGDTALITGGPHVGSSGEVFWVGRSKYGDGMRYGIRGEGEDAYWVDSVHVRKQESESGTKEATTSRANTRPDDALPPEAHEQADELPPEAYEGADELPPEAYEGSDVLADDDLPF